MKNFPIEYEGKTYWISRSCAAVAVIFAIDGDRNFYILANKRGKGAPDFQGLWNMPCGYIDYGESGQECAARETLEETGVELPPNVFNIIDVNTDPRDSNNQNITIRYSVNICYETYKNSLTKENCEKDEVDDVKLINIKDIDKYEWAFNHRNLIQHYYDMKFGRWANAE